MTITDSTLKKCRPVRDLPPRHPRPGTTGQPKYPTIEEAIMASCWFNSDFPLHQRIFHHLVAAHIHVYTYIYIIYTYMGVSKNRGTPKLSILIGFSITNHPFWGTLIFGNSLISIFYMSFSNKISFVPSIPPLDALKCPRPWVTLQRHSTPKAFRSGYLSLMSWN